MKVSVIIPTLNEESTIREALENLLTYHKPDEIIVVDGGSTDKTVLTASRLRRVISSEKGRAHQMNVGARHAQGDIFLFLHADTRLPQFGIQRVKGEVAKGHQAGRFRLRFDRRHLLLRFYESYARFQLFSYGDQAFFVTREVFNRLEGFDEHVPFEDIDFYRRLRKIVKPVIIGEAVTTSARRFAAVGLLKQKLINLFLVGLYYLGFNVAVLKKKLYPELR